MLLGFGLETIEEAKVIAARDLAVDNAAANVDFMRKMVRLEGKPMPVGTPATPATGAAPGL